LKKFLGGKRGKNPKPERGGMGRRKAFCPLTAQNCVPWAGGTQIELKKGLIERYKDFLKMLGDKDYVKRF